jgi:hypothetical protein
MDAGSFAVLRLASVALFLLMLTAQQKRLKDLFGTNWLGEMLAFSLYMISFSCVYTKLDTERGHWFYLVLFRL